MCDGILFYMTWFLCYGVFILGDGNGGVLCDRISCEAGLFLHYVFIVRDGAYISWQGIYLVCQVFNLVWRVFILNDRLRLKFLYFVRGFYLVWQILNHILLSCATAFYFTWHGFYFAVFLFCVTGFYLSWQNFSLVWRIFYVAWWVSILHDWITSVSGFLILHVGFYLAWLEAHHTR